LNQTEGSQLELRTNAMLKQLPGIFAEMKEIIELQQKRIRDLELYSTGKRKRFVSAKEAAEMMGVTPQYIYNLMHTGILKASQSRGGSRWLIEASEIDRFLADNQIKI
jgi:excisionase family DNA binding protein